MKKILLSTCVILFFLFTYNIFSQDWNIIFGNSEEDDYYLLYKIAVSENSTVYVVADNLNQDTTSWLFSSNDDCKTWTNIPNNLSHEYVLRSSFDIRKKMKFNSKDNLFILIEQMNFSNQDSIFYDNQLFKSNDLGKSFSPILNNQILKNLFNSDCKDEYYNLNFAIAPNDDIFVCFEYCDTINKSGFYLIKSSDDGFTWQILSTKGRYFSNLIFHDDSRIFSIDDVLYYGIYQSTDYGKSWSYFNYPIKCNWPDSGCPKSIQIDDEDNLYVLDEYDNIYKSTDSGINWFPAYKSNQPIPIMYWNYEFEKTNNGTLISSRLYSKDDGNNWSGHQNIFQIDIKDSVCYGLHQNDGPGGLFIVKYQSSSMDIKDQISHDIYISPNPANEYIEIDFERYPTSSRCWTSENIEIYNVLGECVKSMPIHPMTRSHRMNIEDLVPGVYFVRIGNGAENITFRFVIMR